MKRMLKGKMQGMALPFALGLLVVLTGLAFTLDATVMRSYRTLQTFEYRCQLRSVMEELTPLLIRNFQNHPDQIKPGRCQFPNDVELPPEITLSGITLKKDEATSHWILIIEMERHFGDASVRLAWWVRFTRNQEGSLFIVSIDEV